MPMTEAQCITLLKAVVHKFEEIAEFGNTDATNLVALDDAIDAASLGDYREEVKIASDGTTRLVGAAVGRPSVRDLLAPVMKEWMETFGRPERDLDDMLIAFDEILRASATGAITNITQANPAVVSSAGHTLVNGDTVRIPSNNGGGGMVELEGRNFTVANVVASVSFELSGEDSTGHTAYVSGGHWERVLTLDDRDLTYGAPVAAARNFGNGVLYRLTVDKDNYPLQKIHTEPKEFECFQDQGQLGERHREVFIIRGTRRDSRFPLTIDGSGLDGSGTIKAASIRDSQTWLRNPDFSGLTGTPPTAGAPITVPSTTAIKGWVHSTPNAGSQVYLLNATTSPPVIKAMTGQTKTFAIAWSSAHKLTQTILEQKRSRFSAFIPYFFHLQLFREGTADGTFTMRWGSKAQTFNVSTLTNAAWNQLKIDRDQDCYYRNWKQDLVKIEFELTGITTGKVYIREVIFSSFVRIDGSWYTLIGGSVPFQVGDIIRVTDLDPNPTRGRIPYWVSKRGNAPDLPVATGGLEEITDP